MDDALANPNYSTVPEPTGGFRSLGEFYAFYLGEHANHTNRRLHIIGTSVSMALILYAIAQKSLHYAVAAVIQGYFMAWLGHFVFEKNKPATFRYPVWSFQCDWRLWYETVIVQRRSF